MKPLKGDAQRPTFKLRAVDQKINVFGMGKIIVGIVSVCAAVQCGRPAAFGV
jgi:hypothetical protein